MARDRKVRPQGLGPQGWWRYPAALGFVAASTGVAEIIYRAFDTDRLSMVFLAGVLGSAVVLGPGPAYFAAGAAFVVYDIYLVQPRGTFTLTSAEDVMVLVAFLSVAVLTAGGFAAAWCYGREFSDGTAGARVGLPVRPATAGLVKALLLAGWLGVCVVAAIAITLVASLAVGGEPGVLAWRNAADAAVAGLLAVGLALPFAWVASLTRSPLGTIGVLIAIVAVTQIVVVLGVGLWFPYAVPSLLTGMGGPEAASEIQPGALAVTAAVAPLAVVAVARYWQRLNDV